VPYHHPWPLMTWHPDDLALMTWHLMTWHLMTCQTGAHALFSPPPLVPDDVSDGRTCPLLTTTPGP
jgi:hypothetical protein